MADVYKATMVTELYGVGAVNVVYWGQVTPPGSGTAEEEIKYIMSEGVFWDAWAAMVGADCQLACLKVQKVAEGTPGVARIWFLGQPGENSAGECLPSNVALSVRYYADEGGKRNRGRSRFMGIVEPNQNIGRILDSPYGGVVSDFANQFSLLIPGNTGSEWRAMLYSPTDALYKQIVHSVADPILRKLPQRTTKLCGA